VGYLMWSMACFTFVVSTFVGTAPIGLRNRFLRVCIMYFFGKVMCGVGASRKYIVGTNTNGYLFHLTAESAKKYRYVSEQDLACCAFSIVRNPYSRMVSLYQFNKRIGESFEHFVNAFYKEYQQQYVKHGRTHEFYIYCHVLPMHCYTHDSNGKQLVPCIIKQEDLKHLAATEWKGSNVRPQIAAVLTGIPHVNRRKTKKKWDDYYTEKTRDLVLDMYKRDFEIFGYSTKIYGLLGHDADKDISLRMTQDSNNNNNIGRKKVAAIETNSIKVPETVAETTKVESAEDFEGKDKSDRDSWDSASFDEEKSLTPTCTTASKPDNLAQI